MVGAYVSWDFSGGQLTKSINFKFYFIGTNDIHNKCISNDFYEIIIQNILVSILFIQLILYFGYRIMVITKFHKNNQKQSELNVSDPNRMLSESGHITLPEKKVRTFL